MRRTQKLRPDEQWASRERSWWREQSLGSRMGLRERVAAGRVMEALGPGQVRVLDSHLSEKMESLWGALW